jgi:hypothetical protein
MRSKQNKLKRKVSRYQRAGRPKTDINSQFKVIADDKLKQINTALAMLITQPNQWTVTMVEQLKTAKSCLDDIREFLELLLDKMLGPRILGGPHFFTRMPIAYKLYYECNQSDFLRYELQDEITKVRDKLANIETALNVKFDDISLIKKCADGQVNIKEIYTVLSEVISYINNGYEIDANRIAVSALGKYERQQEEKASLFPKSFRLP